MQLIIISNFYLADPRRTRHHTVPGMRNRTLDRSREVHKPRHFGKHAFRNVQPLKWHWMLKQHNEMLKLELNVNILKKFKWGMSSLMIGIGWFFISDAII